MRLCLNDKQREKLSDAWANLGTVGFLGTGVALVTAEQLFTTRKAIVIILGWLLCQIASIQTLKGRDE